MKYVVTKKSGYSLVEVSISVFVLAIGVCSLLSIFPVAMNWGSEAMAGNTGSLAAKTALAYLQEDTIGSTAQYELSDGDTKEYRVGKQGEGGYYVPCKISLISPRFFEAVFRVYKLDFGASSTLSAKVKASAEKNILGTYTTYIYDKE